MLLLKSTISVIILGGLLLACAYAEQLPPPLAANITFRCLWWSEAQMEAFNPNSPPPKTTEVTIHKWEYTDPVGVPHPDSVDVVVVLTNEGTAPLTGVVAVIAGQWHISPMKSRAKAVWSRLKPLQTWQSLTVTPGKPTVLRIPVDITTRISELEKRGSWPRMFRASLTVRVEGTDKPLLNREVNLTIRPGD
ncbi:MAG TPA: hypothetical protein PLD30_17015 [Candidatus Competibacteraceae bacterium]|nr:hypothetical protein [Candidatus Contendobacter sp.]MDS4057141.1 hypothetical protein [Candidatus Contendobacter sp.]HRD48051.1 hypothetical protein [Candidatus Contendobacter sp.]HRF45904.1 hypothetical protein [Candidatus Competibacteraceae bacterium]